MSNFKIIDNKISSLIQKHNELRLEVGKIDKKLDKLFENMVDILTDITNEIIEGSKE